MQADDTPSSNFGNHRYAAKNFATQKSKTGRHGHPPWNP